MDPTEASAGVHAQAPPDESAPEKFVRKYAHPFYFIAGILAAVLVGAWAVMEFASSRASKRDVEEAVKPLATGAQDLAKRIDAHDVILQKVTDHLEYIERTVFSTAHQVGAPAEPPPKGATP